MAIIIAAIKASFGKEEDNELYEEAMDGYLDLIDNNIRMFKGGIKEIYAFCKGIAENEPALNVKKKGIECLVSLVENRTNFVKSMKKENPEIFEIILKTMILNIREPDEEWTKPKIDVKTDDEIILFCIDMLNRLIETLGEIEALPIISKNVKTLVKSGDWKQRAIALICYS
eukprot:CAMPEP_0114583934 /NCGR_PEP_ID=MMETSP0125-20121206/7604_1 /TAXON_ID=485358 ORGANISM="Aristerostoma sp., Strain ATCC 50986" /NCGR_SAMPLE_ID=MMETSP0125 /ASSEMBLY_ACC=CAM_ASM_000245 /LENGTH=171 /DNA_ID=CAMNT_0001777761 /DNA_START=716 /DNA_END=1231 /DNA_ORIENTATION=-